MSASIFCKLVITLWLLVIAYVDARTATISNWLTLPVIALLGGWRILRGAWYALETRLGISPPCIYTPHGLGDEGALSALVFMILAWGLCFALWELHIMGGGDAKTLMGLFALFPTVDFGIFLAAAMLILTLPLLWLKLRGSRLRDMVHGLGKRLRQGPFFPTQHELAEKGRPYAWTFCLAGVIYLWFLW